MRERALVLDSNGWRGSESTVEATVSAAATASESSAEVESRSPTIQYSYVLGARRTDHWGRRRAHGRRHCASGRRHCALGWRHCALGPRHCASALSRREVTTTERRTIGCGNGKLGEPIASPCPRPTTRAHRTAPHTRKRGSTHGAVAPHRTAPLNTLDRRRPPHTRLPLRTDMRV